VDSRSRRSAQTVLAQSAVTLAQILSPILSFTAEEVWQQLRELSLVTEESVALTLWEENGGPVDRNMMDRWNALLAVRREVQAALEVLRQQGVIGSSLEAEVTVSPGNQRMRDLLQPYVDPALAGDDLASIFITSAAELAQPGAAAVERDGVFQHVSENLDGIAIEVRKTEAGKCARCWRRDPTVGEGEEEICDRCRRALAGTLA
jgi:isoleucyl-tRNA synthetase